MIDHWEDYNPTEFIVTRVDQLPWPEGSMRCPNKEIWRDIARSTTLGPDERQLAFESRFTAMADTEFANCPRHDLAWAAVGELAADVLTDPHLRLDDHVIRQQAADRGMTIEEANETIGLFGNPIVVGLGLLNGQHRVCCLKRGSGKRVVIQTV